MPTKSNVKLANLAYVIVYVKDTVKALPFYRDTLGMRVKVDEPNWIELDAGATTFALHSDSRIEEQHNKAGQPVVVFRVDNIHETYEALENAGVKFICPPTQVCEVGPNQIGMSADFTDPDGNFLAIYGAVNK